MVFRAFAADGAAPAIAVGLDVTRQTVLTEADLQGLADAVAATPRGPALTRFLIDAAAHYFELMAARGRPRALVMHDPLAVAVALDPSLVVTRALPVDVETRGELTRGQTLADFRGAAGRIGVALEVEATRFRADYWRRSKVWRGGEAGARRSGKKLDFSENPTILFPRVGRQATPTKAVLTSKAAVFRCSFGRLSF